MDYKMLFSFLAWLAILKYSSSIIISNPVEGALKVTWAFKTYYFVDRAALYSGQESYYLLKNFDFGPFGASKLTLELNSAAALKTFKEMVSIHFDSTNNAPTELFLKEISNSTEINTLTFDLIGPDGVHDVYISIPSNAKLSDFGSVRFYSSDPIPGQSYHLVAKATARVLDICPNGGRLLACTHALRARMSQKFKFEKDSQGGFKLVTGFDSKVLSVVDGFTGNTGNVGVEPFSHMSYQFWIIQEFEEGFRIRPRHSSSKCLNLFENLDNDGAVVGIFDCNGGSVQTWYISKAC